MAKSTYSGEIGNSKNNPTGSYKFIKGEFEKEFKFRLVNEEAIAKRREQLSKQIIGNTGKTSEQLHEKALTQFQEEYNKKIKYLHDTEAETRKTLQSQGQSAEAIELHIAQLRSDAYDEYVTKRDLAEEEFAKREEQYTEEANKFAVKLAESRYRNMTANQQALYKKEELAQQTAHKQELINRRQELKAQLDITADVAERQRIQSEISFLSTDIKNISVAINETETERSRIQETLMKAQFSYLDGKERERLVEEKISEESDIQARLRQELVDLQTNPEKFGVELDSEEFLNKQGKINQQLVDSLSRTATYIRAAGEDVKAAAEAQNNDKFIQTLQNINKLQTDAAAKKDMLHGDPKKSRVTKEDKLDSRRVAAKEERALQRENDKLDEAEKAKQANEDFGPLLKENIKQSVSAAAAMKAGFKMLDDLAKSIDTNIESFYQYQAQINARLQGSEEDFKKISKTIKDNVGFSGIVSQKEVVNNIKQLTDSGVAYNLELRAFLATTKDKIADTFDTFNSNLLRVIRIQQADTTAARLGMEASLTKLFNQYFSDTSYLGSISQGVSEALLEASAQMTRDNSIAFEYIVQKWLGALYSIGLSQDTVNTIAEGINYLSTGNIEALNNNDSMRTLFAMSASEAGMDFGELLLEGLNPEKTNLLLKSMVEYLGEIATNISENKVTQSVYADLFGTSRIDLQVFANLKDDVESISQSTLNYKDALDETNYQLTQVASRIHLSQMLNTVLENVQMDTANNIGGNFMTYGLWKTLNIIEGLTGGISIPAIGVMGNMVDLDTTVTALAKAGMAGLSMMSSLLGGLASGNLFGSLNLEAWGFDEYTARGKNITAINKGFASGTSESSSLMGVGNTNAEDVKTTSLTDATDEAEEDSKITNKERQEDIDLYTQIRDALYKDENTTALTELQSIRKRLDDPFITNGSGGGGGGTSTGAGTTGTSTSNATNVTSGGNELLPITENLIDILTTIQGIRGRLDTPFAISNPSVIVQDPTSTGGFTVIQQEPSTVNQELLTQIRDSVTDGGTSTLIKELQGIRGRLDEPFGTQLVTTQNSISDLIEQTHINSSTIKDMLTSDSFKSLINTSNSSNNEINTNNTIDQTIDAMGVLLSLLSLNRVFKVEFDDSKGTINNQTSSSTSTESTNSNINSTTYVEAIANHTNVISQLTTAVHDLNSSIVSTISEEFKNTQLVDNISSLQSQVSAISSTLGISNIQGTNAKNDVYLNGMADDVKSSLATSIAAALTNILTKSVEQGHSISIADIQNMLSLMNLNVTVTNDYFSDVLRKEAFNN